MEPTSDRSGGAAYIADIATVLPRMVDACELANILFARDRVGGDVH